MIKIEITCKAKKENKDNIDVKINYKDSEKAPIEEKRTATAVYNKIIEALNELKAVK